MWRASGQRDHCLGQLGDHRDQSAPGAAGETAATLVRRSPLKPIKQRGICAPARPVRRALKYEHGDGLPVPRRRPPCHADGHGAADGRYNESEEQVAEMLHLRRLGPYAAARRPRPRARLATARRRRRRRACCAACARPPDNFADSGTPLPRAQTSRGRASRSRLRSGRRSSSTRRRPSTSAPCRRRSGC